MWSSLAIAARSLGPGLLLVTAAMVSLALVGNWHQPMLVSNDGIQYLEGARSLARGEGFSTRILIYDANFAVGTLPAGQTTFPPGFSALIALPMLFGADDVAAAVAVSALALVATGLLLGRAVSGFLGALLGAAFLLNFQGLTLTTVVASDVVFTAFAFGALLCAGTGLGRAATSPGAGRSSFWQAGALAAAAVACRFAGVFLLAALGLFFGVRFLRRRALDRFLDGVALLLPGALMLGALFARNAALSGDFDGGALDAFSRPWREVLERAFWGAVTVVGVAPRDAPAFVPQLALTAGAASGLLVLLWPQRAQLGLAVAAWRREPTVGLCLVFVAVYLGTLLHLSHTRNSIVLLPRYLLPLVPALFLPVGRALAGLLADGALRPAPAALAAASVSLGLVLGGFAWAPEARRIYFEGNPVVEGHAVLHGPMPDGRRVLDHVRAHLPIGAPLLAEPGHAIGRLLGHPTLGPIGSAYSGRPWTPEQVLTEVRRHGVEHAIHLRGLSQPTDTPGFWRGVATNGPPPWLVPVFEHPDVTVYRIAPPSSRLPSPGVTPP
ncbi:hypothetical protein L6V77_14735 [Myxococcota bacterium]|nr:hypothetical protein [Myxococcota bacterium]